MIQRFMSWLQMVVVIGGNSVEYYLVTRVAVRSWNAAIMASSRVVEGITQLCGSQKTVWTILVARVDGVRIMWHQ